MREFLSTQLRISASTSSTHAYTDGSRNDRHSSQTFQRNRRNTIPSSFKTNFSTPCYVCQRNNHTANLCKDRFKMSPSDLLKLTRSKRLCQACFLPFQQGHTCNIKCSICNGRHIKFLHKAALTHEREAAGGRQGTHKSSLSSGSVQRNFNYSSNQSSKPGFRNNFKKGGFRNATVSPPNNIPVRKAAESSQKN